MKRLALLLTILFTCLSLFSVTAEARRMGGGSSFGKQRAVPTQPQRAPDAAPRQGNPAPAQTPPPQQGNRWLGPLAGLAIGAGLGSLFGGAMGGAGGGILLALVAAGVLLFLVRRFMKPKPQYRTAHGPQAFHEEPAAKPRFEIPTIRKEEDSPLRGDDRMGSPIPADFPVESFLRGAKVTFIRLQAANDRKDLDDIREYTTPEVFAEISMQVQESGNAYQKTEVLDLNAELLEAVTEGNLSIASVRYTGKLSENGGAPEAFDEIWHVQRDLTNPKSGWLLSGIQQTAQATISQS